MRVFPADNGNSPQYAKLNVSDAIANILYSQRNTNVYK